MQERSLTAKNSHSASVSKSVMIAHYFYRKSNLRALTKLLFARLSTLFENHGEKLSKRVVLLAALTGFFGVPVADGHSSQMMIGLPMAYLGWVNMSNYQLERAREGIPHCEQIGVGRMEELPRFRARFAFETDLSTLPGDQISVLATTRAARWGAVGPLLVFSMPPLPPLPPCGANVHPLRKAAAR